jgi:2-polyprenyl-6-methoxyphenol hydroxylase-like FAD-dependent oxidoreductase
MDRQRVLENLYGKLGDRRDCVFVDKKTVNVENLPDGIRVHCADGSVYEGDLVVGADGVRSTVRQAMWKSMEEHGLQNEVEKEKKSI